jgi:hypothetical protein
MVGTTYTLTCDDAAPGKIPQAPAGIGGQIGIVPLVGNANTGTHFPIV